MSVKAVALFGSQARGNAEPNSDVDILLVTSERKTRHVAMGNVSIYLYPWSHLLRRAGAGDLFVCHIAKEAKSLYDPERRIAALHAAFQFKASYAREIGHASDLGWYIALHHQSMESAIVTKRIAWCVRTILIAHAAEQKKALFSASALAQFSGCPSVMDLIAQKDEPAASPLTLEMFGAFLKRFATGNPVPGGDPARFRAVFRARRNRVAQQSLRADPASALYGTD